ncbi:Origin of replication complex subunit [Thalictrum thalictroides]|uniref:Origin of replication complex subunit n=1 Tax=Thalictrum thalictroides TaxID=46969 RepID=A0A7J6XGW1_THATH|nr:Origin of replication complex subunit [Thalictrum thalictroides]
MDVDEEVDEEEFGFSKNYFLAKELRGSTKKSAGKLCDLNLVDEQELRDATSKLVTKHEKEIVALMESYRCQYQQWLFELRLVF